jgi:flavin reductase (DIM6/NTAB) family NADH-FMN oxidoreductase RutF
MPVEPAEFRRIMGHWTTGVAVLASVTADGVPCGLTANAVASVALQPPLVLACVERAADTHDCVVSAGCFSISMLSQTAEQTARRFAGDDVADKFRGLAWHTEITGAPVLDDALAWVDCRVRDIFDGGDHSILVGEVVAGDALEAEPLVYYRSGYHRLAP